MAKIAALGKGLKTTAQIITAVGTVVGAGIELKGIAQPVIDSDEGKAALEKSKDILQGLKAKTSEAKSSVNGAVGKVATAKAARTQARSVKKEEKELARQLKKARQVVLEGASQVTTYKDLAKRLEQSDGVSAALVAGSYSGSGCFVVTTYSNLDFDNDLTDYLYVYIGKGEVIGEAIMHACSREGDPDLYADTKYKQNVHAYAFPCTIEEMDSKYEALTSLFQDLDD